MVLERMIWVKPSFFVKDKDFYKTLVRLSLPAALQSLISLLVLMADNVMVSRFHAEALAPVSQANSVSTFVTAALSGLGGGAMVLISQYWGKRDTESVKRVFAVTASVCLLFAAVIVSVIELFPHAVISVVLDRQEAALTPIAISYLRIACLAYLPLALSSALTGCLKGVEVVKMTLYAAVISLLSNVCLNALLIFGLFGLPRMAVAGAALATVIGQFCGMAVGIGINHVKNHEVRLNFRRFRPDWHSIKGIYQVGLPSIIMQSIGSVMTFGMNKILIAFTETAVSVFGVYFKLQSFVFMPVFGLNNGMVPIIGYNYGANKPERIHKTIKLSMLYATLLMVIGFAVFHLWPDELLLLFDASEDMLTIGNPALRIISYSFLLAGVNIIASSSCQAFGFGMYSLYISAARQLLVLVPAAYLLSLTGALDNVWLSFPIAEVVSIFVCLPLLQHVLKKTGMKPVKEKKRDQ